MPARFAGVGNAYSDEILYRARLSPSKRAGSLTTEETGRLHTGLARRLAEWQREGASLALMIGGPDGLSARCLARASLRWSLSPLTLPHALVRVVVAEQLYRAWSILHRHPYHRE